jgi:hypothetical protein
MDPGEPAPPDVAPHDATGEPGPAVPIHPGSEGGAPQAPSPSTASRRLGIIVVVVAAIVLIAAIWISPIGAQLHLPGTSPGGPSSSAYTFSQAFGLANATLQSQEGGSWNLESAAGIAVATTSSLFTNATGNSTCPFPTIPAAPVVSSTQLLAGQAGLWLLTFQSVAGGHADLTVLDGGATVLDVTQPGSPCNGRQFGTLPPGAGLPDSSQLLREAQPALGMFVHNYSAVNAYFELSDEAGAIGTTSGTAIWVALFSPCPLDSTEFFFPGNPAWYSEMNATNGTVVLNRGGPGIGGCATDGGLGLSIAGGSRIQYAPPFAYSFSITSASTDLAASSLRFGVVDVWGQPVAGPVNCTIEDASGSPLATYTIATGEWTGGSTEITATDSVVLDSTVDLGGSTYALVVESTMPPIDGTFETF